MTIQDFAQKYCVDILQKASQAQELLDLDGFSYDEVITTDEGYQVKVINTPSYQIPLQDILGLDRDQFAKIWNEPEALEAYDNYVATLIIIDGEDVLNEVRNTISRNAEALKQWHDLPTEF